MLLCSRPCKVCEGQVIAAKYRETWEENQRELRLKTIYVFHFFSILFIYSFSREKSIWIR